MTSCVMEAGQLGVFKSECLNLILWELISKFF